MSIYDVVIIGAGPAGLQAALHGARKKADCLVLGRPEKSSIYRAHVENYFGVKGVREGRELLEIGLEQVKGFGAQVWQEDVLHIEAVDEKFAVAVESGREVIARTIIFTTGTSRKKLKVAGEKELAGRGVSYCVDCDANFYRNVPVAVVGNESAAVDGALTLTGYASEVFLITRGLSVSDELRDKLAAGSVTVLADNWVKEITGESAVTGVLLEDGRQLAVEGIFIELGAKGALELATAVGVQLDMETFTHIDTDKQQQTNIPGIYAAGDITGHPYQMAKAVGEGCVAGFNAASQALKRKRAAG